MPQLIIFLFLLLGPIFRLAAADSVGPPPAQDWLERQAAVIRALEDAGNQLEKNVSGSQPATESVRQTVDDVQLQAEQQAKDPAAEMLRRAVSNLQSQVNEAKLEHASEALAAKAATAVVADPRFGSLTLFWHFRAPQAETLVPVLFRLRTTFPGIPIHQKHVMHPSGWEDFLFGMKQAAVQMEAYSKANDPRAWDLHRQVTDETRALTSVCEFFGIPGVSPFDRIGIAVKYRVDVLPSWRYLSRRSIVHGLTGCGPNLDLASWITQCEAWDGRREEEARSRSQTLGDYLATYRPTPDHE